MSSFGAVAAVAGLVAVGVAGNAPATHARSAPQGAQDAYQAQAPALAIAQLDRKVADLAAEEEADRREIERSGIEIAQVHARVLARGKAFYRLTRAGMMPIGGGFDALVDHAMRVERAHHALAEDLATEKKVREHAVELSRALDRIAHDKQDLATQRNAMDTARLAAEDESRRQQAFDRAFSASTGASGEYVAVYGGGGGSSADMAGPGGFASAKGRLLFPVSGRAEARPGHREGTEGPGLEILAPVGSGVRAVYAGRIAFADRYGPYGRIVIVDHGDHYYSVSGNLASVDVKVGQEVAAGERIGSVGDDGQGAMLYFEVRHGAETVAPSPWLGLP